MSEYRHICLNLLSRSIKINEERFSRISENLGNCTTATEIDERIKTKIKKEEISKELENYKYYEQHNFDKTIRRVIFTQGETISSKTCLFTDAFHNLIDIGAVNYDYRKKYLHIYDLSKHLDICLAIAFDCDYHVIRDKLLAICDKYKLSMETLSQIVLICSADIDDDIDFKMGDIFEASQSIAQYVKYLIKENYEKNISMLDLIETKINKDYFFEEDTGFDRFQELLLAFRMQIAYSVLKHIISTMENYQDVMGDGALIFSKHLFGFTINSNRLPTQKMFLNVNGCGVEYPVEILEWQKI